jgi:hypothetical protein
LVILITDPIQPDVHFDARRVAICCSAGSREFRGESAIVPLIRLKESSSKVMY